MKKLCNMGVTAMTIEDSELGTTKRIVKETGGIENQRTIQNHLDHNIKIGQNTEKNPGNLRRFALT